jgi:hypothetical protein
MASTNQTIVKPVPLGWLGSYLRIIALLLTGVATSFSETLTWLPLGYLGLTSIVFGKTTNMERLLVLLYYLTFLVPNFGIEGLQQFLSSIVLSFTSLVFLVLLNIEAHNTIYILRTNELVINGLSVEDLSFKSRKVDLSSEYLIRTKNTLSSRFARTPFQEIEIFTEERVYKLRGVPKKARIEGRLKKRVSAKRVPRKERLPIAERMSDGLENTKPEERKTGKGNEDTYKARKNLIDDFLP